MIDAATNQYTLYPVAFVTRVARAINLLSIFGGAGAGNLTLAFLTSSAFIDLNLFGRDLRQCCDAFLATSPNQQCLSIEKRDF